MERSPTTWKDTTSWLRHFTDETQQVENNQCYCLQPADYMLMQGTYPLKIIGRVSSIVISKVAAFSAQPAQNTVNAIVYYDTSSTKCEDYGKFFFCLIRDWLARRIELCPSLFGFILFVLYLFFLFGSFFLLVVDCTTTQRRCFAAVKYLLFTARSTFLWKAIAVFFLFFPCIHSGKVQQASVVLPQRPPHHKGTKTREAFKQVSPKFSGSSSAIFTSSRMLFFNQPTWPKARAVSWQLALDLLWMLRKKCSWEGGGVEKKNKKKKEKKPKQQWSVAWSQGRCMLA